MPRVMTIDAKTGVVYETHTRRWSGADSEYASAFITPHTGTSSGEREVRTGCARIQGIECTNEIQRSIFSFEVTTTRRPKHPHPGVR